MSNFSQTQRATHHPSDLVPYSQETKAQKQIFPKEKDLLSWEREACAQGHPQTHENHYFLA